MSIYVLSVRQPWASMIADGRKTIETRTWCTKYRGPILIASTKKPEHLGPHGCLIATAHIMDCRPMTPEDEAAACCTCYPGAKSWTLKNIRPIKPIPVRGARGLWVWRGDWSDLEYLD